MLLEREQLLDVLADRLERARAGEGSLVLLAGEAGAGKTSVVRAFARGVGATAHVVDGACDPLSTPRPLGPLHDFAASADGPLAGLPVADGRTIELFGEVLRRLRAAQQPVVVIVEDVHWADDGTLDFVRFVGRRVVDTGTVVVCTYRDDEVTVDHPLQPVLGSLVPLASTVRLVVPALTIAAVARLADGSTIDPDDLHAVTGGNAFYVTEVLAATDFLPASVRDAVMARVAQLDSESRRVVEAVSIAPRSADVDHVRTLTGAGDGALDRAVAAGVLMGEGRLLRFPHELARAAVEDSLPPARRLALHRRTIDILASAASADRARLAHHAVRSGDPAAIVEHVPPAADEAVARGARREAVALYEEVLQHADTLGADRTADLQLRLAVQLRRFEQPESTEKLLRSAIGYLRGAGDVEALANALALLQSELWVQNRYDEGFALMGEALAALRPLGPTASLARCHYRLAHAHMLARHRDLALGHLEQATAVNVVVGSEHEGWRIAMMTGTLQLVVGDPAEGVRLLTAAVADAERLGDHDLLGTALSMLGSGGGEVRRYDDAIPALWRSIELGLATDSDYEVGYSRAWMARIAFEQGRWDDAVEWAELVDRTSMHRRGISVITALSALARVRVRRGDPGGLPLLDEMVALAAQHELQHGWNALCGRAEYLWLDGRGADALDVLAPVYARALDTDSEWARGEIGFWMWRVGAIVEPPEGAAAPFALHMAGRWRDAAAAWRTIGCPYEAAMALADGDPDDQLEAVDILTELGAAPMADLVRSRLREQGVTGIPRGPRRQTRANPAGLTARQLEVLELMVDGLSNGEIAAALYVSPKTVEHHVSAILAKLSVTTRARAIAAAGSLFAASGPPTET